MSSNGRTADEIDLVRVATATGAPLPGNGRGLPSIRKKQPLAPLALEVGQALSDAPLFRRGETLVTVDATTGEVRTMTAKLWRSWHQKYFNFVQGAGDERFVFDATE